jgi:biopolymer transport protein ExbD
MRMPEQEPEEGKFAMAPLIDMVFLLLVFFMCASHLNSQKTLPMEIPEASRGVVPKDRPGRHVISIVRDGQVYDGSRPIEVEQLKQMVAAEFKANPGMKIYVRADKNAHHKEVKKVMNAMAEVGIADFIFGVYNSPESRKAQGL